MNKQQQLSLPSHVAATTYTTELHFSLFHLVTPQPHTRRIFSLQALLDFNLLPAVAEYDVLNGDTILGCILDA
jgi:hypothetical protein